MYIDTGTWWSSIRTQAPQCPYPSRYKNYYFFMQYYFSFWGQIVNSWYTHNKLLKDNQDFKTFLEDLHKLYKHMLMIHTLHQLYNLFNWLFIDKTWIMGPCTLIVINEADFVQILVCGRRLIVMSKYLIKLGKEIR